MEALDDPTSSLTYPALTGPRKQSVVDVEHLFCPELSDFMEKKGYYIYCLLLMHIISCRNPKDILGFSRETVVALITNIEGREWYRRK